MKIKLSVALSSLCVVAAVAGYMAPALAEDAADAGLPTEQMLADNSSNSGAMANPSDNSDNSQSNSNASSSTGSNSGNNSANQNAGSSNGDDNSSDSSDDDY